MTNQLCCRNLTFYSRMSPPGNCCSITNQRNSSLSVVRHIGDQVDVEVVEEVKVVEVFC